MKPTVITKLSLMMLLEYFIWGAWYVTMSTYMAQHLNASGVQIGAAYSALAIATMISPFFIGMVADRYFAAQRIMGVLHLTGAALLFLATQIQDNTAFYWVILFYSLLYMPTIALSNSIAFNQMSDPGRMFPWVRVFGTVGWIIAGLMIIALDIEGTEFTFQMAAIASAVLGLFSFMLPDTPPKGKVAGATASSAIGTEAMVLFKNKPYLIFFYRSNPCLHPALLLLRIRKSFPQSGGNGRRGRKNDAWASLRSVVHSGNTFSLLQDRREKHGAYWNAGLVPEIRMFRPR